MKILKIFGIVAGLHLFALVLIFANPGCSASSAKTAAPVVNEGGDPFAYGSSTDAQLTPLPIELNEGGVVTSGPVPVLFGADAPVASGGRYSPTRPGTPAATALQPAPVTEVVSVSTYTVVRGDSLWSLAKKHNLTIAELAGANSIAPNAQLQLGQRLIIPAKSGVTMPVEEAKPQPAAQPAAQSPAPAAAGNGPQVLHVVKSGETLGAIARKYGTTVGEIATTNRITDPARIRPGLELVITGAKKTPAAVSPAPSAAPATTVTPRPAAESRPTGAPVITLPAKEEDLDAGLRPGRDVPVIRIEETAPTR